MILEGEFIEREALADLHAAASPELTNASGLRTQETGSALLSVAGALPASAIVINRTVGLGLSSPATRAEVDDIIAAYGEASVARYFVHVHPAAQPDDLVDWLRSAGLQKTRGWQKFHRGTGTVPKPNSDLEVREIGADFGEAFGRIACDAFDLGDDAVPWLALLPDRPHWRVFMSFQGDEPAGTGALFVKDGLAWTDFGATAPEFRRRGSQSALLARRIECALDLGCRAIFTCTGEDVPGDPQHSYKNILKTGFKEDYIRENYAPPKN